MVGMIILLGAYWFLGLRTVCTGLRVPNLGQCIPSAQTRYQDNEEGSTTGHVGWENQCTYKKGDIP
jgi:hypothetical protein